MTVVYHLFSHVPYSVCIPVPCELLLLLLLNSTSCQSGLVLEQGLVRRDAMIHDSI